MSADQNSPQMMVRIYIDNSNIYIQGAKTTQGWSNPSWRYDVSRLRNALCSSSKLLFAPNVDMQTCTKVYGSVPPPRGFCSAMASKNITVHTYDRSPATGKEKMVDMKMGVDIAMQAVMDRIYRIQSEYIIVTGDADLYPAVEQVKENGFTAHVWSWRSSFSNAYIPEFDDYGRKRVNIYHLDDIRSQFEYLQTQRSDIECKWGTQCRYQFDC